MINNEEEVNIPLDELHFLSKGFAKILEDLMETFEDWECNKFEKGYNDDVRMLDDNVMSAVRSVVSDKLALYSKTEYNVERLNKIMEKVKTN